MKKIAISFALSVAAICIYIAWQELASPTPNLVNLGNFIVLSMTLVVLVWYAYDTNTIAKITQKRWEKEGVLATTYNISMPGASVGDVGHTIFQLSNTSLLLVRAKVNFNFKLYGLPVSAGGLYNGSQNWLLYPQQMSQGWFDIESLVKQQGKSITTMQAEFSEENRKLQLTMLLELTFWDELGTTRTLPPRPHYFDFQRWAWIPSLGEQA